MRQRSADLGFFDGGILVLLLIRFPSYFCSRSGRIAITRAFLLISYRDLLTIMYLYIGSIFGSLMSCIDFGWLSISELWLRL